MEKLFATFIPFATKQMIQIVEETFRVSLALTTQLWQHSVKSLLTRPYNDEATLTRGYIIGCNINYHIGMILLE